MSLSETDKREVCPLHGWVGRRVFQTNRHDLCEAPEGTSQEPEDAVEQGPAEDLVDDDRYDEKTEEMSEGNADEGSEARWSDTSARRRGIPSKKTIAVRRITQVELAAGRTELQKLGADEPYERPQTRGDCRWCPVCQLVRDGKSNGLDDVASNALGRSLQNGKPSLPVFERMTCGHLLAEVIQRSRPCVFVACKYSLYLDVSETGSIILNFPHLEPGQMGADRSCALDLSERGSMTLEEIAAVTNLTRERIRQVEMKALIRRARPTAVAMGLGSEDAATLGGRHQVGPSADLEETGVEGAVPSDVSTILTGNGWDS